MELKTLVTKNKNKLLNIVAIILSLIISSNIYKQQNKTMDLLRSNNEAQIKRNRVLEEISKLERKVFAYKELLAEKDSNLTINAIGNIAKEAGIQIASLKPEPQQRYEDYIKAPFSLIIKTFDYHAFGDFMSRLESSPIVYVVDYIDIKPDPKEGMVINLRVSLVTFTDSTGVVE